MQSTVSITEAQAQFPKLVRELEKNGAFTVQRRGKVAAFVLSPERMEGIIESMEILANRAAMKAVRDFENGKVSMKEAACLDED